MWLKILSMMENAAGLLTKVRVSSGYANSEATQINEMRLKGNQYAFNIRNNF